MSYTNKDLTQEYWDLLGKLKTIYTPPDVAFRARAIREIRRISGMGVEKLARTLGCSVGHIHQLIFLSEKATTEQLNAYAKEDMSVAEAYYKLREKIG